MALLIVAATEEELAQFASDIDGARSEQANNFLYCAVGIGMLKASVVLTQFFERTSREGKLSQQISRVVWVGSVGANPLFQESGSGLSILQAVTACQVELCSLSLFVGSERMPRVVPVASLACPEGVGRIMAALGNTGSDNTGLGNTGPDNTVRKVKAGNTLGITEGTENIQAAFENGIQVESMELLGVAQVCDLYGIPWNSISVVTNFLGTCSHSQWLENKTLAAQKTARLVAEVFCSER